MNRRFKVQSNLLVITAVVVSLVFVTVLIEVLTGDFSVPFLYETLIGVAFIGLSVWSLLRLIELFSEKRYYRLSEREKQRTDKSQGQRRRRTSSSSRSNQ